MTKRIFVLIILFSFSINAYSQENSDTKYWIFFKDKGEFKPDIKITKGSPAYEKGIALLSERAIKRRLKVLPEDNLIDFADLPLDENYVTGVKNSGVKLNATSRWLNGVSAYLTTKQLDKVKALDYVSQIKVVNKLYKQEIKKIKNDKTNLADTSNNIYNYGNSFKQMQTVNVPKVHNLNITGKGVMIASFDDGFDWKHHETLKNLDVIDEYDFINEDKNTFRRKKSKI